VSFQSPEATEAIIPELLQTVWEEHQPYGKDATLWEALQQGSVSGDCFIKVAFEEEFTDPAGNFHNARIRVLPLNSAFCVPVDENEILTKRGWLSAAEVRVGDEALALDPESDRVVWSRVEAVNVYDWDGPLHEWHSEDFSAATTPDHRWVYQGEGRSPATKMRRTEELHGLTGGSLVLAGGELGEFPSFSAYSDEFVELVGWVASKGWFDLGAAVVGNEPCVHQDCCGRINKLSHHYQGSVYERANGFLHWYFPVVVGREVQKVLTKAKALDPAFLSALTLPQARLLYETILDGDDETARTDGRERLYTSSPGLMGSFQMLAALLGKRSSSTLSKTRPGEYGGFDGTVGVHQSRTANMQRMDRQVRHYRGHVWCPTTSVGTWVTRRKEVISSSGSNEDQGSMFKHTVYVTGNCFPEKPVPPSRYVSYDPHETQVQILGYSSRRNASSFLHGRGNADTYSSGLDALQPAG